MLTKFRYLQIKAFKHINLLKTEKKYLSTIPNKLPIECNSGISENQKNLIIQSKKFQDWLNNIDLNAVEVKNINLLNVYMFGNNVGFVNLEVNCTLKNKLNKKIPGFVFLRGKAVAILVIVNEKYIMLTKQMRVPVGKYLLEIPAGMLDESGDLVGTAIKEIKEETGVSITAKSLIKLDSYYTSPGGTDEEIELFYTNVNLESKELDRLTKSSFGEASEGEYIKILIEPFNIDTIVKTKDSKALAATLLYYKHKNLL